MSDGIAPAVDKVGAPEPTSPEAQAGAPTMGTTEPTVTVCPPHQPEKSQEAPAKEPKASDETKLGGSARAPVRVPRPVEVVSVPQTPLDDETPVNGTPRPELNIPMETEVGKPQEEPIVMTRVEEPLPTPIASVPNSDTGPDPIVDKPVTPNGDSKPAEMKGALQADQLLEQNPEATETITGEKRKLEDTLADTAVDEPSAEKQDVDEAERVDKKAKVDTATETKTNGGTPARGRPGRPKKDKNAPPVVGKTARKTRSQGPVEV